MVSRSEHEELRKDLPQKYTGWAGTCILQPGLVVWSGCLSTFGRSRDRVHWPKSLYTTENAAPALAGVKDWVARAPRINYFPEFPFDRTH